MPPVSRKGDICTGHDDWPSRPSIQGSDNVYVNSIPVHRQSDAWSVHCNNIPVCHGGSLASGSSSVYVNNLQISRIGDPVDCGSAIATGSPNVYAGG